VEEERRGAKKELAPVLRWGQSLARLLSLGRRRDGRHHQRLVDGGAEAAAKTPKGQVAVYVGGGGPGEPLRYVVPVVYFNHPMFGELLREAEEAFGFHHPGGITIPCAVAEFERAAAVAAAGKKGFGRW
jgi:SAUR family protein